MSVTTESVTTEEVHKQIVRRWVKEVFNEHKLDSVERLNELWDAATAAGLGSQGWFLPLFTSGEG